MPLAPIDPKAGSVALAIDFLVPPNQIVSS